MTSDVEFLKNCLFTIHLSSSGNYFLIYFAHVLFYLAVEITHTHTHTHTHEKVGILVGKRVLDPYFP